MAIQLGSAYGKVNIDSSGVKKGVGEANQSLGSLENSAKKLGATLQNIGKAMTVAITIPMALMAKEAVMTASAYEESLNKMNVVFGENSDVIKEWSLDAAKNLGMSQQQALEATGTFGNLFTSMGLGRKPAADMSMGLVQLAADLASFNNLDPALVLEKLRSGLVGEVEPLRTLGINLTMAATKTKALEMGLADANGELSQSALLQARYALMLEQSTNAQGDFARTSEGLANSLKTFKATWGDTLKILGEQLVPIVTKVLTKLNEWLDWFNKADPKTQKFIEIILLIVFVAGPLLFLFGKALPLAFSGATKSLNPFSGGIFGLVGTFVKWVGIAATVVKVLGFLGISTGAAGTFITGLATAIGGVGLSIAAVVGPILLIIGTLVLLYLAFKNNWFGITDTVKQAWFLIGYYLNQMVQKIGDFFKKIDWKAFGRWMLQGLANGMLGGIPMIVSAAMQAGQAALAAIKRSLGISSPSKEFMKLGIFSGEGFQNGLRNAMNPNDIARTMAKPVQNMSSNNSTRTTINLSGGLTLNDVDRLMDAKINRFAKNALGGI